MSGVLFGGGIVPCEVEGNLAMFWIGFAGEFLETFGKRFG
jgi:hypothetical protein